MNNEWNIHEENGSFCNDVVKGGIEVKIKSMTFRAFTALYLCVDAKK